MIKLPAREDGQWTVQYASDKMPDLIATRNITFDREGYLRLSKPMSSFYSSTDDADFGIPILYQRGNNPVMDVLTDEAQFTLDRQYGELTVAQSARTNTPVTFSSTYENYVAACYFNRDLHWAGYDTALGLTCVATAGYPNNWSEVIATGIDTTLLSMEAFNSNSSLAIGMDNLVKQWSTSYVAGTTLTLPPDVAVTGLAYNNGYLGITTHDNENAGNGMFFVWDGKTTAANYSYRIGASTCTSPKGYKGSFVFLTGDGRLMLWSPQELVELAALPAYFNGATYFVGSQSVNRNESIWLEGDVVYINIDSTYSSPTVAGELYAQDMPGGVWCYDPAVGLYHRNAPTATKTVVDKVATTSVDTTDNEITVAAAPDTGTPVKYCRANSTAIGGLTDSTLYYTIKVDATTVKLATTYANALLGTAIDLTGTGNSDQTFQFYPKPDYGQSYIAGIQGCVNVIEYTTDKSLGYYSGGVWVGSVCAQKTTTAVNAGGFTLPDTENRGYFITSKFQSQQLQDDWQKIFIKHSELNTALDKVIIKYRTTGDGDSKITKITASGDGAITWTDSDTFTTTDTQWANVQAGDEVEVIQGAGSGYLLHVSSISENSGTYTVNLDEAVKNIAASDTGRAIVSRWTKLTTLTSGTITNEDGYSEIAVGVKSKSIQFKIELRGEDVEIEEIIVAHTLHKPVA